MRTWGLIFVLAASFYALAQEQQPSPPAAPSQASQENPSPDNGALEGDPAPTSAGVPATGSLLDLTPDAQGKLSPQQMQALIRVVAQNYRVNYRKQHDYTYVERDVQHKLDASGKIKATDTQTYEVMQLYDEQVMRLIEKNDKPLNEKDAAKEEDKLQKLADKRNHESEEERRKREEQREKQHEKAREFVSEVADAYSFRMAGSEMVNGRDAWVIDGEPRPDFHPGVKEAEVLEKIRGRLWIDKSEQQLVKMDIQIVGTISFGWVMARIHAGTNFVYEQTRVNDEVWLPLRYSGKLDMRIALFKSDNELDEGSYRDYKKFRTSSKILGIVNDSEQK